MKRDPEKTLSGRLALMTEDRDHFKRLSEEQAKTMGRFFIETKGKDDYILSYKRKIQIQLDWYRNHIQALVSKIPAGE